MYGKVILYLSNTGARDKNCLNMGIKAHIFTHQEGVHSDRNCRLKDEEYRLRE